MPPPVPPAQDAVDLRELARPVWVRRWYVIALAVLVAAATYVYYDQQPRRYEAATSVLVQDNGLGQFLLSGQQPVQTDRTTINQAAVLGSREVAVRVAAKIGFRGDPAVLQQRIVVAPVGGSDFVSVSTRGTDPVAAARLVNVTAQTYVRFRRDQVSGEIETAERRTNSQLSDLSRRASSRGARQLLSERLRSLQLLRAGASESARQVSAAEAPTAPVAPRPVRSALFALVLTLLVAVGLAYLLDRLDRTLKAPEEIERRYGMSLLATIPHTDAPVHFVEGSTALAPEMKESFRALRTSLQLAALDDQPRSLLVTSAIPGEGKSTVVRNLAIAYAEAGLRVAVVECDLRRPTLSKLFAVEPSAGLTEVLIGGASLADALIDVPIYAQGMGTIERIEEVEQHGGSAVGAPRNGFSSADDGATVAAPTPTLGHLALLTSGEQPANPQAVLAADRTQDLLRELVAGHDIVLIDSPPLLAVSDAVALATTAESILLVGRFGLTTSDAASRASELVGRIPAARPLGVVANDQSRRPGGGLGSYVYYDYGYAEPSKPAREGSRRNKRPAEEPAAAPVER